MNNQKSILIAGLFGNALEWYDFILFANFTPILAVLFFPTSDPVTALLLTFAVFATGFLVRPIGALLFGYIGDHIGRRAALVTSMSIITIPTLLIGCIPTYASIGIAAPFILVCLRLLQGIAISGELNSAATFLIEHAKPNQRGFAGSLVTGTAIFGILVGAFIAFVMNASLSKDQLAAWGWRVPFLLSGILGLVGLIMRIRTQETPKFKQENPVSEHTSIKQIFLFYRKEVLITILLTSIMAVGNYIFIAYVITFLVKAQGFSLRDASLINLISCAVSLVFYPFFGFLSDRFGRKPIFQMGLWAYIVLPLPIFWLLTQPTFMLVLAGDILLAIVVASIAALIPTLLAELFPTHVRNSGTTLGYSISLAIFGGTAPLISLWLVSVTGTQYAPAIYLMVCALVSSLALRLIEESAEKVLA